MLIFYFFKKMMLSRLDLKNSLVASVALLAISHSIGTNGATTPHKIDLSKNTNFATLIEKIKPIAAAGDPEYQNLLGYMYFNGEGVEQNFEQAHQWFHQSAEQGYGYGQRNLGLFHAQANPTIPSNYSNTKEANLWLSLALASNGSPIAGNSYDKFLNPEPIHYNQHLNTLSIGKAIYYSHCAGCHGFDGCSSYSKAPSFKNGERLQKTSQQLRDSVANGLETMPGWSDTLSASLIQYTVAYLEATYGKSRTIINDQCPSSYSNKTLTNHPGKKNYTTFCAGCHGFNGIAYYTGSPSFALHERMEKSDSRLAKSISQGINSMPGWEMMLAPEQIRELVSFIRILKPQYEAGISQPANRPVDLFFRFDPFAAGNEWYKLNPRNGAGGSQ